MIVTHTINSLVFLQTNTEEEIAKTLIPSGYVNLTQLCKAQNKRFSNYSQQARAKAFLQALSDDTGFTVSQLVIEINARGDSGLQGTWGHHLVAINICSWLSPEFEIKASKVIWAVINNDYQALTAEAQEAQEKLQALWKQIRDAGKITRRTLTDAIKDWYIRNPDGTSRPQHVMYAQTTNKIYQTLWGKTAIEIEALLGCERNKSRDFMSAECLQILDRAEHRVMEFIDDDNIKPADAVELSVLRKARIPLD